MKPSTAFSGAWPCRYAASALWQISSGSIERGGDQAVEHERLAGLHRILPVAEAGQAVCDEILQHRIGIRLRHRQSEIFDVAHIVGEACGDHGHDLARDGIGRETRRCRQRNTRRQLLAILVIVVPLAAGGALLVHQQGMRAAHVAVEELHPQRFAHRRPITKRADRAQEAIVGADVHRAATLLRPAAHVFEQPPFAGFGADDLVHAMRGRGPDHLAAQAVGVGGIVETAVIDGNPPRPQRLGEMAHRRQHQRDLVDVMRDVAALVHHLRHQDDVAGGKVSQR
jgi:hypothetical protein